VYSNLLLCLNFTWASSPAAPKVRPLLRHYFLEGADLGGPHNHPEIPMRSHPLAEYANCICANDWAGVAEPMLSSSQKPWKTERLMDSRLACAAERGLGVS